MAPTIKVLRTFSLLLYLTFHGQAYAIKSSDSHSFVSLYSLEVGNVTCDKDSCEYIIYLGGSEFLGNYMLGITPEEGAEGSICRIIFPGRITVLQESQLISKYEVSLANVDKKIYFCLQPRNINVLFGGKWVHQGVKQFLQPKNDFDKQIEAEKLLNMTRNRKHAEINKAIDDIAQILNIQKAKQEVNSEWRVLKVPTHNTDVNYSPSATTPTTDGKEKTEALFCEQDEDKEKHAEVFSHDKNLPENVDRIDNDSFIIRNKSDIEEMFVKSEILMLLTKKFDSLTVELKTMIEKFDDLPSYKFLRGIAAKCNPTDECVVNPLVSDSKTSVKEALEMGPLIFIIRSVQLHEFQPEVTYIFEEFKRHHVHDPLLQNIAAKCFEDYGCIKIIVATLQGRNLWSLKSYLQDIDSVNKKNDDNLKDAKETTLAKDIVDLVSILEAKESYLEMNNVKKIMDKIITRGNDSNLQDFLHKCDPYYDCINIKVANFQTDSFLEQASKVLEKDYKIVNAKVEVAKEIGAFMSILQSRKIDERFGELKLILEKFPKQQIHKTVQDITAVCLRNLNNLINNKDVLADKIQNNKTDFENGNFTEDMNFFLIRNKLSEEMFVKYSEILEQVTQKFDSLITGMRLMMIKFDDLPSYKILRGIAAKCYPTDECVENQLTSDSKPALKNLFEMGPLIFVVRSVIVYAMKPEMQHIISDELKRNHIHNPLLQVIAAKCFKHYGCVEIIIATPEGHNLKSLNTHLQDIDLSIKKNDENLKEANKTTLAKDLEDLLLILQGNKRHLESNNIQNVMDKIIERENDSNIQDFLVKCFHYYDCIDINMVIFHSDSYFEKASKILEKIPTWKNPNTGGNIKDKLAKEVDEYKNNLNPRNTGEIIAELKRIINDKFLRRPSHKRVQDFAAVCLPFLSENSEDENKGKRHETAGHSVSVKEKQVALISGEENFSDEYDSPIKKNSEYYKIKKEIKNDAETFEFSNKINDLNIQKWKTDDLNNEADNIQRSKTDLNNVNLKENLNSDVIRNNSRDAEEMFVECEILLLLTKKVDDLIGELRTMVDNFDDLPPYKILRGIAAKCYPTYECIENQLVSDSKPSIKEALEMGPLIFIVKSVILDTRKPEITHIFQEFQRHQVSDPLLQFIAAKCFEDYGCVQIIVATPQDEDLRSLKTYLQDIDLANKKNDDNLKDAKETTLAKDIDNLVSILQANESDSNINHIRSIMNKIISRENDFKVQDFFLKCLHENDCIDIKMANLHTESYLEKASKVLEKDDPKIGSVKVKFAKEIGAFMSILQSRQIDERFGELKIILDKFKERRTRRTIQDITAVCLPVLMKTSQDGSKMRKRQFSNDIGTESLQHERVSRPTRDENKNTKVFSNDKNVSRNDLTDQIDVDSKTSDISNKGNILSIDKKSADHSNNKDILVHTIQNNGSDFEIVSLKENLNSSVIRNKLGKEMFVESEILELLTKKFDFLIDGLSLMMTSFNDLPTYKILRSIAAKCYPTDECVENQLVSDSKPSVKEALEMGPLIFIVRSVQLHEFQPEVTYIFEKFKRHHVLDPLLQNIAAKCFEDYGCIKIIVATLQGRNLWSLKSYLKDFDSVNKKNDENLKDAKETTLAKDIDDLVSILEAKESFLETNNVKNIMDKIITRENDSNLQDFLHKCDPYYDCIDIKMAAFTESYFEKVSKVLDKDPKIGNVKNKLAEEVGAFKSKLYPRHLDETIDELKQILDHKLQGRQTHRIIDDVAAVCLPFLSEKSEHGSQRKQRKNFDNSVKETFQDKSKGKLVETVDDLAKETFQDESKGKLLEIDDDLDKETFQDESKGKLVEIIDDLAKETFQDESKEKLLEIVDDFAKEEESKGKLLEIVDDFAEETFQDKSKGKILEINDDIAGETFHGKNKIRKSQISNDIGGEPLQAQTRKRRQIPDDFVSPRSAQRTIFIEGIRIEDSDKEPKIIEEGIPSVLAESAVTLRVYGEGLAPNTVIAFTHDPQPYGQPCKFLLKGEYMVKEGSLQTKTALFEIRTTAPITSSKLYICAKNLPPGITDPNKDEGKYLHQGTETWKMLATHKKLLPLWVSISLIVFCLMFSALFSGLNLGLMSLDRTELKIISNTGTEQERKYARAIMPVRDHGNYLLCSILLGNVAVNSTFTILLDELTSGLFAVIFSTLAIVLLGEITPQAICSRHGLMVGAKSIMVTKGVMAVTAPLSFPVSKLLDYFLGEEIGNVYNRERLKELVKVTTDVNDLDKDEVNIISGALEMRKKTVSDVMTKLEDVFMLPISSVLDFETMSEIVKSGYSRIPVYEGSRTNIVTVLFIKDLAFVDPDDNTPLRTLCQYYQNPCNFVFEDVTLDVMFRQFKDGHKGHMAFVHRINNEGEGDPFYETIGLVTLEDVIEEMIQAEIVDETDVFLDNRSKRRRRPQNKLQDFAAFAERHENQRIHISPQLTLATFQFLSTSVDAFRPDTVSETVLRRLLKQDVIQYIKIKGKTKKDASTYVFQQGKPVDYFLLILEGRVEVTVGRENLVFEAGPFTYFGVQALTQNVGVAESPTPSAMGSLQNINMDAMLRHTFVPDYSVRAITSVYYLTVKRSLYMAAKRATLMEKGNLSKGGTTQEFDTEVDKLLQSVDEDLSITGEHKTPSRQVSPHPMPVSPAPRTIDSRNEHAYVPASTDEQERLLK